MNHHDGSLATPDAAGGQGGSQGRGGGLADRDETREWRQVSFRTSGLTVELEIVTSDGARRLTGHLLPRQSAVVDIRHASGVTSVPADPLGRFSADGVPAGRVSLRCRLGADPEHPVVVTGWVALTLPPAV